MSIRLIKEPSVESGPWTRINNQINFKSSIRQGMYYNLKNSYWMLHTQPDTSTEVENANYNINNAPCVHNYKLASADNNQPYTPSALVLNSRLVSDNGKINEYIPSCNLMTQSLGMYTMDPEMLDAERKYGFDGDVDIDGNITDQFMDRKSLGNVGSSVRARNLLIPINRYHDIGNASMLPYWAGNLHSRLELDNQTVFLQEEVPYSEAILGAEDCDDVNNVLVMRLSLF